MKNRKKKVMKSIDLRAHSTNRHKLIEKISRKYHFDQKNKSNFDKTDKKA